MTLCNEGPRTMSVGATPTTTIFQATCKRCETKWEVERVEGVFVKGWLPMDCPNPNCAKEQKGKGFTKVFGIEIPGFTVKQID